MRVGWSLKDAAAVLDINERRVTQSLDPTLDRVAKLWRVDPTRTMQAILAAVNDLEPMSDAELDLRIRIQTGRADRSDMYPGSG